MKIIEFNEIKIGIMPIENGGPMNRREHERATVNEILTEMFGPEVILSHNQDGAPTVNRDVHISITHSQKVAAVAIAPYSIGIDAEEWRQALQRVKSRFLGSVEQERISSDSDLLKAWTTKEAVYKCAGIRLLTGPEISICSDFTSATARNIDYALTHFTWQDTQLTIAQQKN